ncbi:MAG: hypothetical protein IPL98_11775 [Saprospiraceae bacterium]|jgi:hypothetical protein|nr:hypothetical protein [Saprospiraceae bacterium]
MNSNLSNLKNVLEGRKLYAKNIHTGKLFIVKEISKGKVNIVSTDTNKLRGLTPELFFDNYKTLSNAKHKI